MSGTHTKSVIRIGLDDTDHIDYACTTEHFHRLLSQMVESIDGFQITERRLVRLWPFAPERTRGKAALSAICTVDSNTLDSVDRICVEFIEELHQEIQSQYPEFGQKPSPCLLLALEDYLAGLLSSPQSMGFLFLLGIALLGGMLTNLTPCVYPMIPITLRLLGRQTRSPLLASCCYASGIVVSYSVLGVVAILTGSLFGQLMASVTFNLIVSVVMFGLAWTMMGFGSFASLQQVGSHFGASKKGIWRTFLMGMGAGLIASPCTGPILASLLTYTTMMANKFDAVFLVFAYSLGFGLPYILLGRMASSLTRFKLPGVLQSMIKVVFASIRSLIDRSGMFLVTVGMSVKSSS